MKGVDFVLIMTRDSQAIIQRMRQCKCPGVIGRAVHDALGIAVNLSG